MKKIILGLLLIFCVVSMASAANFVEIGRDENYLIYIDMDSLQNKGDYLTCWIKTIPRGKELEKLNKNSKNKLSFIMLFSAYKVNERQMQALATYFYYEDSDHETILNRNLTINGWEEIIPQTYAEFIWEYLNLPR